MSGIWLPLSALTINVFLVVIFFIKKNIKTDEVKEYGYMLIIGLIFSLFGVFGYLYAKMIGDINVISLLQRGHLTTLLLIAHSFCKYNLIINKLDKTKYLIVDILFKVINVIIVIFIFISPIETINYGDILDVNGVAYYFAMAGVVFYLFGTFILNVRYFIKNNKNIKKNIPFAVLMILFGIGILLRAHYPEIITETYCVAFALLTMYFTIENPDVKMIEQINIAKDHAEKANAAKTDFLSSMSHEIRTPLNAIVGFSEAIEEETDVEAMKNDAKDIVMAAHNLLELVNGILDISKIEANKMEIVEKDYNPNELFNDLAKLIKPRIGEKPIELSVNIAKDLPAILHGDEGKVKQITTNILTNAVKYTEKGSIKYNVSCVNMNNTSSLVISVEDTGRGIKEDQIDKLFNKFERLDEDRNTTLEGTGLGLAITKRLVEMMGGKIVVQSVYGSGSKFTIYLKQEITALTGELEKEEEKELANNDFSDSRVLVVDDNLLNLKVAKRLLKNYNIDSYDSDSGFDCISRIESKEVYDLILLDDMMPKMSGSETLEKLKKFNNFKTPVVVLTANAIEGMKDSYLAKGFDDYLAKPIEKTELERVLNKFLKPTEKEIKEEKKEEVKETKQEESTYNNRTYLEENEIDVNHGLELLGDMETYNSIMSDFITEMEERLPKLEEYKNNSDMENYAILVHAIKSDCKYLGIMKLADHNYEHELKSKANDIVFVLNDYDNLIKDINHYLEICKKYIEKD